MLLPQPLGPLIATNSFRATSSDTPSSACTVPCPLVYSRVTSLSEIKPALSASEPRRANDRGDFSIVAETDDSIVVEKPPFLLVHPTKPSSARTLWGELKQLLAVNGPVYRCSNAATQALGWAVALGTAVAS